MATLGAVLGCGRHLASTVVTGSRQWSSTLLAELRLSTILVLALRAFHCGPRRKKRARCTARVTSHMIGDKADALHEIFPEIGAMLGGRIGPLSSLREEEAPAEAVWGVYQSAGAAKDSVLPPTDRPQSPLIFAARITLPHFSVSSARRLPKSAGEPASSVPPSSISRVFSVGSLRAALISRLSVSMIAAGVCLGAPRPNN